MSHEGKLSSGEKKILELNRIRDFVTKSMSLPSVSFFSIDDLGGKIRTF